VQARWVVKQTPKKPQEPAAAASSRNSLTKKSQELERKK